MHRTLGISLALIVALAGLAPATAGAQGKTVLKFAHHAPVTFPYHDGVLRFKELVEKQSGGRVEIQVFGGAQLGGERDILEGVRIGTVHFGIGTSALPGASGGARCPINSTFRASADPFWCLPAC